MPPYGHLAAIIITAIDERLAEKVAKDIILNSPNNKGIRILGPSKAAIYKLSNRYRYRILIISDKIFNIQKIIAYMLKNIKSNNAVRVKIDINPYNFI